MIHQCTVLYIILQQYPLLYTTVHHNTTTELYSITGVLAQKESTKKHGGFDAIISCLTCLPPLYFLSTFSDEWTTFVVTIVTCEIIFFLRGKRDLIYRIKVKKIKYKFQVELPFLHLAFSQYVWSTWRKIYDVKYGEWRKLFSLPIIKMWPFEN
jgi:hypothetical protein